MREPSRYLQERVRVSQLEDMDQVKEALAILLEAVPVLLKSPTVYALIDQLRNDTKNAEEEAKALLTEATPDAE